MFERSFDLWSSGGAELQQSNGERMLAHREAFENCQKNEA